MCGFIHFEDPKVAVVAFIEKDDRVLLVKRAVNPERGKWALPAGFVDYGESPEAALIREVKEETNLDVTVTRLVSVQGNQEDNGIASIIITYGACVVNGTASAQDDAEDILWYSAHDPLPELAFESTQRVLAGWRQHHPG